MSEGEKSGRDLRASLVTEIKEFAVGVAARIADVSLPKLDELGAQDVVVACACQFRFAVLDYRKEFEVGEDMIHPEHVFARLASDGAAWLECSNLQVLTANRANRSGEEGHLKRLGCPWSTIPQEDKVFIAGDRDESPSLASIVEGLETGEIAPRQLKNELKVDVAGYLRQTGYANREIERVLDVTPRTRRRYLAAFYKSFSKADFTLERSEMAGQVRADLEFALDQLRIELRRTDLKPSDKVAILREIMKAVSLVTSLSQRILTDDYY